MFQVYFLSVLTNVLVGLFLVFEKKLDSYSYFTEKKNMISIIWMQKIPIASVIIQEKF